jgi:hypothetical protein
MKPIRIIIAEDDPQVAAIQQRFLERVNNAMKLFLTKTISSLFSRSGTAISLSMWNFFGVHALHFIYPNHLACTFESYYETD